MKEVILDKLINNVKKYKNYDNIKLKEIRYGIEVLYLTITKVIVISIITLLLGIYKEFILLLLLYSLLRLTGFGIHTNTSKQCYILSISVYIIVPYLIKITYFNNLITIILSIMSLLIIIIHAPADTEKRPLINNKKRKTLKIITSITTIVYIILIFIIKSNYYKNLLLYSIILQALAVHPIIYKLLGLRYNNYKAYKRKE